MTLPSRDRTAPHPRRRPRVLTFSTPHCPNCAAIASTINTLRDEFADRVDVVAVGAATDTETVRRHRVRGVPTVIALDGDEELARHVGRGSEPDLRHIFEAAADRQTSARHIPRFDRLIRTLGGGALLGIAIVAGSPPLAAGGVALATAGWWDMLRR